jgi:hypothetical protein
MMKFQQSLGVVVMLVLLTACMGNSSGGTVPGDATARSPGPVSNNNSENSSNTNTNTNSGAGTGTNNSTGSSSSSTADYFAKSVQPNMAFCRNCHVAGGIADTADGKLFMLSSDPAQDYSNVYTSWIALGKGVAENKILTKPSDAAQHHSGGQPWPVSGQSYIAMQTVLTCWDNPASCTALGGAEVTTPVAQLPLLGSSHARSYMSAFCESQPDNAALPQDPRELIRPGVNAGRAVAFNAYWQDCTGPSKNPRHKPVTCGEYRTRRAQGEELMRRGLSMAVIPSSSYDAMWQRWGLTARPAEFDAQVRERYGLPKAPYDNPYPVSGGGIGQLPAGLVQKKNADGSASGMIGITCDICHSGELMAAGVDSQGAAFAEGLGANTADFQLLLTDALAPMPIGLNNSRGVTNAEGLSGLLIGLLDLDTMGSRPEGVLLSQIPGNTTGAGDTKMPAWWNASRRPRKFWDGGFSYDAARLASAILHAADGADPTGADKAGAAAFRSKMESDSLLAESYIESLQSPPFPGPIDTALAEQGAILFHGKNLWAGGLNADIPKPLTNGSCAGCHGAYSPRYVNDPAYLADPRLEGIAGYISPIEQIRTDPQRVKGFTKPLLETMSTSWFAYPEGSPGYVPPEQKDALTERLDDYDVFTPGKRPKGACTWQGEMPEDAVGYLAPPLHGIWATAPYLHNASVPDVWSLLKPDERPAMWRRQLTSGAGTEHGLDTRMAAYDTQRLGWKYQKLDCTANGVPYFSCEPAGVPPAFSAQVDFINALPGSLNSLGYQVTPPLGRDAVEARKIFNTHQFAKSNTGHDFTKVLTDPERRALIEYLKTL